MSRLRIGALVVYLCGCESRGLGHLAESTPPNGRAAPPAEAAWSPGDDIPGWEDYDCGALTEGAGYVQLEMPDVASAYMVRYGGAEADRTSILVGACDDSPCVENGDFVNSNQPFADVYLWSRLDHVDERGQGIYGPSETYDGRNRFSLFSASVVGRFENDDTGYYDNVDAIFCLSRVRPDMMEGTIRMELTQSPIESLWYDPLVILLHVVVPFADHGGGDGRYPDDAGPPPEAEFVRYSYTSYDDAWPWDEITDPAIRAAVYDRYLPWNTP